MYCDTVKEGNYIPEGRQVLLLVLYFVDCASCNDSW